MGEYLFKVNNNKESRATLNKYFSSGLINLSNSSAIYVNFDEFDVLLWSHHCKL